MNILLVSNLYPPYYIGGYELAAFDVARRLQGRGHRVEVLTSSFGVGDREGEENHAHRILDFTAYSDEGTFGHFCGHYLWSMGNFSRALKLMGEVKPDIVFAWNLGGISLSPAIAANALSIPVIYYVSDYWMLRKYRLGFPVMESLLEGFADKSLGGFLNHRVPLTNIIYTSRFVKDSYSKEGILPQKVEVIHHGVDLEVFRRPEAPKGGEGTKMLYVGQITEQKGLHVALRALARLEKEGRGRDVSFTIVGNPRNDRGVLTDYAKYLFKIVEDEDIGNRVNFIGKISRSCLAEVYRSHDLLVLPSTWEEPFSITLLEAMASGLAVVGTTTGGTGEILIDGENGLAVPPENVEALAEAMRKLIGDRNHRCSIGQRSSKLIKENYTLDLMVDKIEKFLYKLSA